jgi:hypothetical protein
MTPHLVVGPLAVAFAAVTWLAVQRAWMRRFRGAEGEPDALAARRGDHACGAGCEESCEGPERASCATGGEERK